MRRSSLRFLVIIMFITSGVVPFVSLHAHAQQDVAEEKERIRYPVSNSVLQQRYPETVVLRGAQTENKVSLTFDDGPDPRFTPLILDILKEYHVKATFFLMGARAKKYPGIVKRMVDEGHVVGNHTYSHPNLVKEADIAIEREVTNTEEALAKLINYRTKLFRAPYGFLDNELVGKLKGLDYMVVGWSVDSLDWQESPPEVIAHNVLSHFQPGAIILMHDGAESDGDRTNTVKALHQIIPALKEQEIEFETVPALLNMPYQK